jgi:hypothetical protein
MGIPSDRLAHGQLTPLPTGEALCGRYSLQTVDFAYFSKKPQKEIARALSAMLHRTAAEPKVVLTTIAGNRGKPS